MGATTQELSLSSLTAFTNLEVAPGTLLVETVEAENCNMEGTVINDGVIRKTKSIAGGPVSFGLTKVAMDVVSAGNLTSLQVDWIDCDHPEAFGEAWTASHWLMTPTGSNYEVDLTIPHAVVPDTNALVCEDVSGADAWDCDRTSATASTVTLAGVTSLIGDWAAGDAPLAGALFADGFEYRCQRWSAQVDEGLDFWADTRQGGEGCGGWTTNRVPTRGLEPDVTVAHGRVSGIVADSFSQAGIAGVEIQFFKDGVQLGRALTAADGSYLSPPMPEGTYTAASHGSGSYLDEVWSDQQCWLEADPTLGQTLMVSANVETTNVDFDLESGGRITGSVVSAKTGDALERAKVRIYTAVGDFVVETITDQEGLYRTPVLPAGTYLATAADRRGRRGRAFGGAACSVQCDLASASMIEVVPGAETARISFRLD